MRTLERVIYYPSRASVIRLWHITDTHVGARACNEKLLKQHIAEIADDDNAYWGFGGDAIDGICQVGDRRYNAAALARWVHDAHYDSQNVDTIGIQADYFLDLFSPIWHKCLWFGKGNHEWAAERLYARNIYWEIVKEAARRAGILPQQLALGASGFINLKFRRGTAETHHDTWVLSIYQHHGYGGGLKAGGHALALEYALGSFDADLLLFGHRHVRAFVDRLITRASPRTGGGEMRYRAAMFSPSYLDAYIEPSRGNGQTDTYSEREGYMPKMTGAMPILIVPNRRQFALPFGTPGMSALALSGTGEEA